jgi:hypothetical protein
VSYQPEIRIDLVVTQGLSCLRRLHSRRQFEVAALPSQCRFQHFPRRPRARARIANIEAFALDVLDVFDARITARQHRYRLRLYGEHSSQICKLALVLERRGAMRGMILPVGLHHAEIKFASANRIEVVDRAVSGLYRASEAVLFAVFVH